MVKKSALQGMPSLLNDKKSLSFDKNLPFIRKLPPLFNKENQKKLLKVFSNKLNRTREGKSRCAHPDRKIYSRGICKQCYNWFYNKVARLKKK